MIDFDRHSELDAQVRAALAFHGLEGRAESSFFDRDLVGHDVEEWRSQVVLGEALELWDELARRALMSPRVADRRARRALGDTGEVTVTGQAPHRELGLTDSEYDRICELLGRDPNGVELAMFSLLWSEHCAYKHSRKLLRRLPTEGPRVLLGPGENAGAVDVGEGTAIAFKVESHNHPSAVEPFQGAATGVGGILRDVFALGARPIAVLDSLRFGELSSERSAYLLDRVVAGIGHYGNSIGVPTVGGEIYFEPPYERNCLVNAMCVGLARADRHGALGRRGARQLDRLARGLHGSRRDRRRLGARFGGAR